MSRQAIGMVFVALATQCLMVLTLRGVMDEGVLGGIALLFGFVGLGYLIGNRSNQSTPSQE